MTTASNCSSVLLGATACLATLVALAGEPRLNDVQLLGSHNSYKLAMSPERFAALRVSNPRLAESLEYWHRPLAEQLSLGLRKLELDVFYDPDGNLFDRAGARKSKFPVLHVQNLDDSSSCANLIDCLGQLSRWSSAHPRHVPIFVSVNAKDQKIDRPGFLTPLTFDEAAWQALDREIRAVLGDALLTPKDVVTADGPAWPELAEARGRFVMILDESGTKRASYAASWRTRAMFGNHPEGHPGAAIMIINDPIADFTRIQRLVRDGFIVRTRADADTREARSGDTTRRERAFASGAQLISTDYYVAATHFGTNYVVALPEDAVVWCNPVRGLKACVVTE